MRKKLFLRPQSLPIIIVGMRYSLNGEWGQLWTLLIGKSVHLDISKAHGEPDLSSAVPVARICTSYAAGVDIQRFCI